MKMKKLLFITSVLISALLFGSATEIQAQTKQKNSEPQKHLFEKSYKGEPEGFNLLNKGDRVAFSIDYSQATIRGLSEQDNSDLMGKEDWGKAKASVRKLFLLAFEENIGKKDIYLFGPEDSKSKYRIIFKVSTIDKDGDIKGIFYLKDRYEDRTIAFVELKGNGGRIGDFVNLMGDGHKDISEKFAKFLKHPGTIRSQQKTAESEEIAKQKARDKAKQKEEKQAAKTAKEKEKSEKQQAREAKWRENIEKYEKD